MPSIISAGTTANTGLNLTADTSGNLVFQTNGNTTAMTIDTSQNVTYANGVSFTGVIAGNGANISSMNASNLTSGTVASARLPSSGVNASSITAGTLAQAYGGTGTTTGYYGFKNRIINGAMVIDQRNAGASVTPTNGQYLVDRWNAALSQASKFSAQQNAGSVTPPAGFANYLGCTSLSAYSITASDVFNIIQPLEGFNTYDLNWGTANAQSVTLSFWVRSSLTGTFGGSIANYALTRSYPFTFTISSANTWEQKSVTIAGDTSGTWVGASSAGSMYVRFNLGTGSTYSGTAGAWASADYRSATGATSVVGTNGATFYITGVQLEVGSTATSFDYRPYGTELNLCLRYCEVWNDTSNNTFLSMLAPNPNNTFQLAGVFTCVQKRTLPTVTESLASTFTNIWLGGASTPSAVDFSAGSNKTINVNITSSTNQGSYVTRIYLNGGAVTSNYVIADAEL